MGSKQKQTQMERKAYSERELKDRLSFLSKKGIEPPKINKDTIVKKLRANIDAIKIRLKAIANNEKKTEELAKIKAEKAAAPQPKEPEVRKEKKEKVKEKEAPAEKKEKKKKKTEKQEAAQSLSENNVA
jgi:hypothetical protein